MPTPIGYSRNQIRLHWLVFALIGLQFALNEPIADAFDATRDGVATSFNPLVAVHVAGGALIGLFALWRLGLRSRRGAPPPPESETPSLRLAARITHATLYLLILALPVSGALAWFGGSEAAAEAHEIGTSVLLVLVVVHVAASLVHQFYWRTNLMDRMRTPQP
jgi:cytochrome b561